MNAREHPSISQSCSFKTKTRKKTSKQQHNFKWFLIESEQKIFQSKQHDDEHDK